MTKRESISFIMGAAIMAAAWLLACAQVKEDAAETTYAGQQLACVDTYSSKTAIDACRERVRKAWGRSDAGDSSLPPKGDAHADAE